MNIDYLFEEFNKNKIRILTKEEEIEIFKYWYEHPNEKENIQTILLLANKGLILSICKKYVLSMNVEIDDLIQFGNMGLLKAMEKFDITKNTKFSSYATFWIKQTINRELQKIANQVTQPIRVSEIRKKYYEIEDELVKLYKREVTFYEVADEMGIGYEDLEEILSLSDTHIIRLNDLFDDKEMLDLISDESDNDKERNELLILAMNELNIKEKNIIQYRYGYIDGSHHTMEECAKYLGITRQRVQQIEKEALLVMRRFIKNSK